MYSCNKIPVSKLYNSHVANLRDFQAYNKFDEYIDRSKFLTEIEALIRKLEAKYFIEIAEHDNGTIAIYVNNLPIE